MLLNNKLSSFRRRVSNDATNAVYSRVTYRVRFLPATDIKETK